MVIIYFDGACLPVNPGGIATYGVVATENGKVIDEDYGIVTEKGTNNIAEWTGFIKALETAKKLGLDKVEIQGDSRLVVNQFNGHWQIRKEHLWELFQRAKRLSKSIKLTVKWIQREKNLADALAHKAYLEFMEKKAIKKAEQEFSDYSIQPAGEDRFTVVNPRGKTYEVNLQLPSCSCPYFRKQNSYHLVRRSNLVVRCKHIFMTKLYLSSSRVV